MTDEKLFCSEVVKGGGTCGGAVERVVEGDFVNWFCSKDPYHDRSVHARVADRGRRAQGRLAKAGIPDRFFGQRFVEDDFNRPALKLVRHWLADFGPGWQGLPAPALYGDPGVGKSHLLSGLCARLIHERDVSVRFFTTRELLRGLQNFEDREVQAKLWNEATGVGVLALDDFGAQADTDWKTDQLADLVDERYQRHLPLLVATNFPPVRWEMMADQRTVSRLRGMCLPVELKGKDRRQMGMAA